MDGITWKLEHMFAAVKNVADNNFVFLQDSPTAAGHNSRYPFSQTTAPNSPELNPIDFKIQSFIAVQI